METTAGARLEFLGVEEQFRKITERAHLFTPEELEELKNAYAEKIKSLLPQEAGRWEEISVPMGKEWGSGISQRTSWGTDWRWVEEGLSEKGRQVEKMREESLKRIEGMWGSGRWGSFGQTPSTITSGIDEARQRVVELQATIEDIQKKKLDFDTSEGLKKIQEIHQYLTELGQREWTIPIKVVTENVIQQIETQLVDRMSKGRSPVNLYIEEDVAIATNY